jgi:hypothetical protein
LSLILFFKVPPQIPGRKSVDGVGSDGVGHAKHAREDSSDVSPGFGFNICGNKDRCLNMLSFNPIKENWLLNGKEWGGHDKKNY